VLGDDALACLKDLKKWLKLYDEKANRLDVARCLAEANLVKGDLLEILAAWPESTTEDRLKSKIALACLELLVPLTWPIEKDDAQMTVNHHRHVPYLRLAQTSYKRAILQHESATILRTAVRTGLPSIALPQGERSSRDEGIIKLLLYFLRNIAMISLPRNSPNEGKEGEVSRSATIEAFHRQDVLALLLTIASNIGEDFNTQDTVIMEVLFHLLKGVDVEKLFMDKNQLNDNKNDELKSLLSKEAGMHRSYAKNAPTRHNRFGTMIWVERDGAGRHSTVSGQDVLKNGQQTLSKMDQSKKWNKPKQRTKDTEPGYDRFDLPVPLTEAAKLHLRSFVEEFLDSSFNPLFNHVRRAIEREAERVLETNKQQFFYLISWFLEAERFRRRKKEQADKGKRNSQIGETFEADSFALIASVLNQESFVLLNRFMQDRLDHKAWREVQAGMRCFTQTLLIVQDMSESPIDEDQEIAENIQNRIFYEETTHDRIIAILRGYKDQGFGYLDTCTEISHVFLRMLERYSRENVDLQVRSRRRARKTKKAAAKPQGDGSGEDSDAGSEMEDVREAERVSKERKFDFTRFSSKFMTQACVDTFVSFAKFYNDLSPVQLKRAHRFFYRVAFKQDLSVMLFRLDIVALFNKIIKGPEGLDQKTPIYREWDELVRQIIKKLIKKLDQRPELAVEILFSKINSTTYYLEYGHEKQRTKATPRAPATLEVRGSMTLEGQIGVVIAILYDDHIDYIDWVAKTLSTAADERQSWEAEVDARQAEEGIFGKDDADKAPVPSKAPAITVVPSSEDIRIAMFKNGKLRLLMTLSGFERLGVDDEPGATWIIPSARKSTELRQTQKIIEQHRQNPTFQYGEEDPTSAEDMLRRKPNTDSVRAEYDDDSDGIFSDGQSEEEFLFPAVGPTKGVDPRKAALEALKRKRRKRNSKASDDEGGLDDQAMEARRKARLEADLEKRRKIKSAEFIHDGDEESDEELDREFFAREEERRKGQKEKVAEALRAGRVVGRVEGHPIEPSVASKKRRNGAGDSEGRKRRKSNSDEDANEVLDMATGSSSLMSDAASALSAQSDNEEDTPLSSPPHLALGKPVNAGEAPTKDTHSSQDMPGTGISVLLLDEDRGIDEGGSENDDEEENAKVVTAGRRRARLAVFADSDDE